MGSCSNTGSHHRADTGPLTFQKRQYSGYNGSRPEGSKGKGREMASGRLLQQFRREMVSTRARCSWDLDVAKVEPKELMEGRWHVRRSRMSPCVLGQNDGAVSYREQK